MNRIDDKPAMSSMRPREISPRKPWPGPGAAPSDGVFNEAAGDYPAEARPRKSFPAKGRETKLRAVGG